MDDLLKRLDAGFRHWKPEIAAQVQARVSEIIELADHEVLDLVRSRATEQEVPT